MSIVYIVSKLFTYLLLPPGLFVLLSFLMAFYTRKFRGFFLFAAFCFYLLSNIIFANFLLLPLERPYNKSFTKSEKADAVVVLGGGNIVGSANLPLASDAYKRVMYALMIAKSQNLPLIFSGGGLSKSESESSSFLKSMEQTKKYLSLEIPFSKKLKEGGFAVFLEDKSLDTFQNAKFTKQKFTEAGMQNPTIYLVTSAYHMKRSVSLYEHFGFRVIPCATDFKISLQKSNFWDYFPKMEALYDSYLALHEYAGLLSLKMRGI